MIIFDGGHLATGVLPSSFFLLVLLARPTVDALQVTNRQPSDVCTRDPRDPHWIRTALAAKCEDRSISAGAPPRRAA